jgi:hypothetical protein
MTLKIFYDPSKGETVISDGSSIILSGNYEKTAFIKEWKIYDNSDLIGTFFLNSALFGWKASVKAKIFYNGLQSSLDVHFCWQHFFTYQISSISLEGEYKVYPHMNDRFSIFLNDKQVASLIRTGQDGFFTVNLTWTLIANSDSNIPNLLLLSYTSFILGDKGFFKNSDYALGNNYWIREAKQFDTKWRPTT